MTTERPATAGGFEARPPKDQSQQSPDQIEAEIERTRERLAGTVNEITDRVSPANVIRRKTEPVRQAMTAAIASARSQVVNSRGDVRTERAAAFGAAAIAALGLMLWRRRR
jgi:hypothetical protein